MVARRTFRRTLLGRDIAIAYAVVVALYLVKFVGFQPFQIPAYLMIVAYDVVEVVLPVLTPYYPIGFPLFLYLLAIIAAGAVRWLRSDDGERATWTQIAGGVCLVVGSLSLLFGAFVGGPLVSPADNPTPLAITGATGIVFIIGAWWLLGYRAAQSPVHV